MCITLLRQMSQLMRLWYLSHGRPAKALVKTFANIKYGSRQRVKPKIRHLAPWMTVHAYLKKQFTEDGKYHNLMRWLKYSFRP